MNFECAVEQLSSEVELCVELTACHGALTRLLVLHAGSVPPVKLTCLGRLDLRLELIEDFRGLVVIERGLAQDRLQTGVIRVDPLEVAVGVDE